MENSENQTLFGHQVIQIDEMKELVQNMNAELSSSAGSPVESIPLQSLDDNRFNSRICYDPEGLQSLAASISERGLLSPIKVVKKGNRYEIVYGHRRVRAARLLGWNTIRAEVGNYSDSELIQFSLVENLLRKNLSDYEKALCFKRMSADFGMKHDEIGRISGYSRSHISNYFRMTELLDEDTLSRNPDLIPCLFRISEHHARILTRIHEMRERATLLRLVVRDNLSVRDLQRIIQRFRSWYADPLVQNEDATKEECKIDFGRTREDEKKRFDITQIKKALYSEFELPHSGDFKSFLDFHGFDIGFSIYSNFPPFRRLADSRALAKEKDWFFSVAPNFSAKVRDVHVQFFGEVALATAYVIYGSFSNKSSSMIARGSVLFWKKAGNWKIVHEHWSRMKEADQMNEV